MKKQNDNDMRVLNIITREVGLLEMNDPKPSAEDRGWADRYQAAHDFICIVKANGAIDEDKVLRLTSLISPNSGEDLMRRIKRIRRGEKLGDLTLGS